ncbi:Dabb family protein [Deinococcus ruber]|uniref:Stress-response A/B barrel domain-containing protein n=1 Tax=Deinococcus ruber TaxID=1848197 RepID=A0A918CKR2_9DEIO|nr:Dabb family protein [Deinococcus ruber]GGR26863.1 hypothetical protein GCM10008957_42920 [Deinococcus ruber]
MFEHIVIFRFKVLPSAEQLKTLVSTVQAFEQQIPGIVSLSAGLNETDEVQNIHNYSLGLRITFQSREALKAYLPHPAHQAFVSQLDGLIEHVVVMDYPLVTA